MINSLPSPSRRVTPFAIKEFEKRNGVFPGDAGPVFELGDGETRAFARGKQSARR